MTGQNSQAKARQHKARSQYRRRTSQEICGTARTHQSRTTAASTTYTKPAALAPLKQDDNHQCDSD